MHSNVKRLRERRGVSHFPLHLHVVSGSVDEPNCAASQWQAVYTVRRQFFPYHEFWVCEGYR